MIDEKTPDVTPVSYTHLLEALKMLRDYVQAVVVRYSDIDYRRGIAAQRAYIHFRYRIPRGLSLIHI